MMQKQHGAAVLTWVAIRKRIVGPKFKDFQKRSSLRLAPKARATFCTVAVCTPVNFVERAATGPAAVQTAVDGSA